MRRGEEGQGREGERGERRERERGEERDEDSSLPLISVNSHLYKSVRGEGERGRGEVGER